MVNTVFMNGDLVECRYSNPKKCLNAGSSISFITFRSTPAKNINRAALIATEAKSSKSLIHIFPDLLEAVFVARG
jgi:hypothetical protein